MVLSSWVIPSHTLSCFIAWPPSLSTIHFRTFHLIQRRRAEAPWCSMHVGQTWKKQVMIRKQITLRSSSRSNVMGSSMFIPDLRHGGCLPCSALRPYVFLTSLQLIESKTMLLSRFTKLLERTKQLFGTYLAPPDLNPALFRGRPFLQWLPPGNPGPPGSQHGGGRAQVHNPSSERIGWWSPKPSDSRPGSLPRRRPASCVRLRKTCATRRLNATALKNLPPSQNSNSPPEA